MKKLPVLLAIDFDMTIVDSHPFPKINGFRKGAKKYINKLYKKGCIISIWTCRTDKEGECNDATDAKIFLNDNGVNIDYFNENHPALIKCFKNDCRKIACDVYIDDKGMWLFGIPSWFILYWMIRIKKLFLNNKKRILSHCKPEDFN